MTPESAGSSLSQVTLVSTLYFRSTWQKKFSFMDSQMLPFTTPEGSTLKVPTMHHTAEVNYGNCPWSIFDLPCNMEQIYFISTDTTLRCIVFPAWRVSQKKSHQMNRPPRWPNWLLIIPSNHKTDPGFKMVPKISSVPVPSLIDQHLPLLHNKLVSCRKQSKGTNTLSQEKERWETEGWLTDKPQYTKSFTIQLVK